MIRFDGVSKHYPDGTVAVDELSLEAPTGQITVLVGPSGCGKTTSLRMVNRMIEPTSGRSGSTTRTPPRMDASQLRRGIGYVIQHAGPLPAQARSSTTSRPCRCCSASDKAEARARAMELLERVGLPTGVRRAATPPSSPAASSSASASPAPWRPTRR